MPVLWQTLPAELEQLLSRAALLDGAVDDTSSLRPVCAEVDAILDEAEVLRLGYEGLAVEDPVAAEHAVVVGQLSESLQSGGANATGVERCGYAYRMRAHLHRAVSAPASRSAADLRGLYGKLTGLRDALTSALLTEASDREFEAVAELVGGLSEFIDQVSTDSSGTWQLVINAAQLKSLLQKSTSLQGSPALTSSCEWIRSLDKATVEGRFRLPEMSWARRPIEVVRRVLRIVKEASDFLFKEAPQRIEDTFGDASRTILATVGKIQGANINILDSSLNSLMSGKGFSLSSLAGKLEGYLGVFEQKMQSVTAAIGEGLGRVVERLRIPEYLANATMFLNQAVDSQTFQMIKKFSGFAMQAATFIPNGGVKETVQDALDLVDTVLDMAEKVPTYAEAAQRMVDRIVDGEVTAEFLNKQVLAPLMKYVGEQALRGLNYFAAGGTR